MLSCFNADLSEISWKDFLARRRLKVRDFEAACQGGPDCAAWLRMLNGTLEKSNKTYEEDIT